MPEDFQRWYDRDPVLSKAMDQLRTSPDKYQAQIALNIIKIIVEHQIEGQAHMNVEDLTMENLDELMETSKDLPENPMGPLARAIAAHQNSHHQKRRWYDVHQTLSSAIQLLADCPDDLQQKIIPSIATMIEETLSATES